MKTFYNDDSDQNGTKSYLSKQDISRTIKELLKIIYIKDIKKFSGESCSLKYNLQL